MRQAEAVRDRQGQKKSPLRTKFRLRAAAAFVGALALTAGGVTGAHAAPGDSAYAEGQWLSGSLLESVDLEDLASLGGVSASNNGVQPDQTVSEGLGLSVLDGVLTIDAGGGIELPINFLATEAGVVDQYAFAGDDASALGASGLISDDGAIEEVGGDDTPQQPPQLNCQTCSATTSLTRSPI